MSDTESQGVEVVEIEESQGTEVFEREESQGIEEVEREESQGIEVVEREESQGIEVVERVENQGIEVVEIEESVSDQERILHLPASKIKKIMKTDDQMSMFSKDAVAAITIATELFISLVAQQSQKLAASNKKKTVQVNHVKSMLPTNPIFDFLEGTLPEYDI